MIRRLRLKFICVNMLIVTVMMGAIFGLVYHFTQTGLETQSVSMLQSIAAEPFRPNRPGKPPEGVQLPFFMLELDKDGSLTAAGGGFEGAFAQFTSWMQPFGNGGSSFPSGHTAAACSVFILTLACDVCLKWNRRRTLVWALCWAYVAFMALCRLVIGRHYLSDTLAAAFVMLLLYLGMRKTKWYRAGARELTAPGT